MPVISYANTEENSTMNVESLAEQLLFLTVRIESEYKDSNGNTEFGVGTGFIVNYKWSDKNGYFLVTNKHVIEKAKKLRFFFVQSEEDEPIIGKTYSIDINNPSFYSNDNNDVSVMPLVGVFDEIQKRKWTIFFKSVTRELLLTSKQEKNIDAMENVVFVGYPSGIYDTVNKTPVIRTGTTATPLTIDYNGKPCFLIDASVFPGSSGSPVFILNKGSYPGKNGGLILGNRFIFLGLISEGYYRNEKGEWSFVSIPTRIAPTMNTKQMINLGIVIKGSIVFETIENLLRTKGELK